MTMKKSCRLITTIIILMLLTACVTAPKPAVMPQPQVIKISSQVYALLGPVELPDKHNRGYMVNSTVIIGDTGVIVIDTGFSDEIGRHIKKIISGLTAKPVTHVINTHDHGDHVLGNSAFSNAIIISSEKCKTATAETGFEWIGQLESMTGLAFPDSKPVPATQTYAEGSRTEIKLQGVKLVIWVPQGSHTNNDLMVYLPQEQVLVAGDILVNNMMPSFRDAHVANWITTLEEILQLAPGNIIPGHGSLMDIDEVRRLHKQMQVLYRGTEAGYKAGLSDSEIRKTLDLGYWKELKYFSEFMGFNINRTFLEVEEKNF